MPLVTIAEMAEHLHLLESTVRYYRDHFTPYIPIVGEGRQRRYPGEAIDVFKVIADILRKNHGSAIEAEETLSRLFPRAVDTTAITQQTTTEHQQPIPQLAERLAVFLTEQHTLLSYQSSTIDALNEDIAALKKQLAQPCAQPQETRLEQRDAALVATMLRVMTEHQPPSWWQRLFHTKSARGGSISVSLSG